VQGSTLFSGQFTSSVVLSTLDKIVVLLVGICSVVLIPKTFDWSKILPSTAHHLSVCPLFFSSAASTSTLLFSTEVGALQGGGLSMLIALGQRWGLGTALLAKALVCFCLLAFLV